MRSLLVEGSDLLVLDGARGWVQSPQLINHVAIRLALAVV